MTMNMQGTRLATASEKGTLIRVFNTQTSDLITELRRGSQPATVYSINFSCDSSLLCASSSHGTIHVFSIDNPSRNKHSPLAGVAAAASKKSSMVPKYFSSEWSFSRIDVSIRNYNN